MHRNVTVIVAFAFAGHMLFRPGTTVAAAEPTRVPTALTDYVNKPDPSYRWSRGTRTETPAGVVHELRLVSQTWHGEEWSHALQVFVPTEAKPASTMLLYNTGGNPGITTTVLGLMLAQKLGSPIAFLFNVPKQPLFDGKTEDALIAETFVRYLQTEDPTWPLLFPMVKSVVRAMDALQDFAKSDLNTELRHFVVTGASKRGWTSWLTAAVGDRRVSAIAPMVIDTLNLPAQMINQVRAFGKPSEMIRDYTARNLVPIPDTPAAQALWQMVDPWVYRSKLILPKLILNGVNDPYWPLDALNSYWDDLPGEKYLLYVPNAGHNLEERRANGFKDRDRAIHTLIAFTRSQLSGKQLPKLTWSHFDGEAGPILQMQANLAWKAVRLWFAEAPSRDFRKSRWVPVEIESGNSCFSTKAGVQPPKTGFKAFFGEAEFEQEGLTYHLSTQIRMLEAAQ